MRDPRDWLAPLEQLAPDLVAPFRVLSDGRHLAVRREVRRLAGEGSVGRLLPLEQLAALEAGLDDRPAAGGEIERAVATAGRDDR